MILFVDLCWTLVPADTTRGLLDHLLITDRRYRAAVKRWDSLPGRVVRRLLRARLGDPGRREFLRCLQGWEARAIETAAHEWLGKLPELTAGVRCLAELRGVHQAFLLSASIDPVVTVASRRWNMPVACCSRLAWDSGNRATGALEEDLVGRKLPAAQRWLKEQKTGMAASDWCVITDDPTDLPLAQAAREAWIIVHPRHAGFWQRHLPSHAHAIPA